MNTEQYKMIIGMVTLAMIAVIIVFQSRSNDDAIEMGHLKRQVAVLTALTRQMARPNHVEQSEFMQQAEIYFDAIKKRKEAIAYGLNKRSELMKEWFTRECESLENGHTIDILDHPTCYFDEETEDGIMYRYITMDTNMFLDEEILVRHLPDMIAAKQVTYVAAGTINRKGIESIVKRTTL